MKLYILSLLLIPLCTFSQTGGKHTFALLDLGYNARSTALGTDFISVIDKDINLGISNPSLYNPLMNNQASFNHAIHASGINYGMASYGRSFGESVTGGASIRYISYGKQDRRDEAGIQAGTFTPGEFIFGVGASKILNPQITVGANVNLLYSQLDRYTAFGASLDLAGTYHLDKANLVITALVKNAGMQFKSYTSNNRAPLPAEFQAAISHKLKHAPFRISLLMHHLNKWDITYVDPYAKPKIDPLTNDTIQVKVPGFGKKLAHHLTYQLEILISKNIHLRMAYDYHRRQEMKVDTKPGLSGFSFGLGLMFKKFSIEYGLAIYSKAGYNNMFTLSTNLSSWKK